MKKSLQLSTGLLNRIGVTDDKQWRKEHNIRRSRKETRREQRKNKRRPVGSQSEPIAASRNHKQLESKSKKDLKKKTPHTPKEEKFVKPFVNAHDLELQRKEEEDMDYYAKKLGIKGNKNKNDDLFEGLDMESGDDSGFDVSENDFENSDDNLRIVKEDDLGMDDDSLSEGDFESENDDESDGNSENLRIVKEDELGMDDDSLSEGDFESESENNGENDGLRIVKEDELGMDDDSLSEGDFLSLSENDSDQHRSNSKNTSKKDKNGKKENIRVIKEDELGMDDDSLSEDDFLSFEDEDEMDAETTMAKLAALKAAKNKTGNHNDTNSISAASAADSDSDSDAASEDENPYVPPKLRGKQAEDVKTSAPSDSIDAEAIAKMRKGFRSSLNKLAEGTLTPCLNSIDAIFAQNSTGEASEALTEEILSILSPGMQHTLLTVYAALICALYDRIPNFGAFFLQNLVTRITNGTVDTKTGTTMITLLMELYAEHMFGAKLCYDLVNWFLNNLNERNAEFILYILRTGGSQLRSDDPVALKNTVILLQTRMRENKAQGDDYSERMKYIVDATVALKNNRQRPLSEMIIQLRHKLRKQINVKKEPLQVDLTDILESDTRGKWWLVGASWKGKNADSNIDDDEDFELEGEPDLVALAKAQLNTDVRRAVFVAIMGAEDYLEACIRIDKLGLKNKQERDIPHVILHCLANEPFYNPFYGLVAAKQCAKHSTMKTFQFRLWDWFSSEPTGQPQLAMHYGRFYAYLVLENVMTLDVLKAVDFLSGSSDTRIFLEIFFVTFYKKLAKSTNSSNKNSFGLKSEPDGKLLTSLLAKIRDPKVLAGIQIVNKDIAQSEAIQTTKDRSRIQWGAQFADEVCGNMLSRTIRE